MGAKLISVKRSLDEVDRFERLFHAALDSLLALIESVDQHTLMIHPELEREFHERFRATHRQVKSGPEVKALEESRRTLDRDLEEHARRAGAIFHAKTEEVRQILLVLAQATDTLQARSGSYGDRFRKIAGRLETVARLDDLDQIRRRLAEHVEELNQSVEALHRDSREMVTRMRTEMDSVRRRLDHAEKLAESDALTGLLNRRGMERRLEAAIAAGRSFSILLFDLNRFKGINDRHGHLCGDEVLKHFARRLGAQFRPTDAVSRWGGDEFLALLPVDVKEAMIRSRVIAESVCGTYSVRVHGREIRVEVSASYGVAEHRSGWGLKEVLALADSLMYQNKGSSG
jgi:diguanylate cyclase (GGDEF)-like protein